MNSNVAIIFFMLGFSMSLASQSYEVVKISAIEDILKSKNDTTYVVNFWATWCAPCVAELPYFEEMHEKYKDEKVKVILVNLDFGSQLESRVEPFLKENTYKTTIWHLDEKKANDYIPKVDKMWSGAIPFTFISRGDIKVKDRKEGSFTKEELDVFIQEKLNLQTK